MGEIRFLERLVAVLFLLNIFKVGLLLKVNYRHCLESWQKSY